jgi:hypothetical protein
LRKYKSYTTIDEINEALEKINKYGLKYDMTAYQIIDLLIMNEKRIAE